MPRFVITGASGAGKSTLLHSLQMLGYDCREEVGRQVVREQMVSGGVALPDKDVVAFRDLLFERSVEAFDVDPSSPDALVFHDRSFLEAIAYSRIIGAPVSEEMIAAVRVRRFADPVFVCAPWEQIFESDAERTHDFEFACRDFEANVAVYRAFGYELIEVPQMPVEERGGFVAEQAERALQT
ncbi:AAA family ATPase [Pseudovibrio brasiliensis]|uniref:AAA family ATPase n=1 Tax=Pseudovibrio brasiliensis TaxID=1898042 RepID=A0ABX8AIB1_9HYPH|nr:AAA family ATPase [Pseudovibrio brasiliensis]QUS54809.1 AAA family ATPase [Pseudovibrio brasiliensis]